MLAAEVQRQAPWVILVQPTETELRQLGYTNYLQPPSPQQAKRLCLRYNCRRTCWMTVRFFTSMLPGETGEALTLVTMTGAARLVFAQGITGATTLDEPSSATVEGQVASGQQTVIAEAQVGLARGCVSELSQALVVLNSLRIAQDRVAKWRVAAQSGKRRPSPSLRYEIMTGALNGYQRAIDRGDVLTAVDRQRQALALWKKFPTEERAHLEEEYPGIGGWMKILENRALNTPVENR